MSQTFEYPLIDDSEFVAERDESGELYRERPTGRRAGIAALGVLLALASVWFAWNFQRQGQPAPVLAGTALIGVLGLAGTVAEAVAGDARSAIVEREGSYYVQMMVASRFYVAALGLFAVGAGVALFRGIRQSGAADVSGRRSGIVTLLDALPFGEFLALLVGVAAGLYLLRTAWTGETRVAPVE